MKKNIGSPPEIFKDHMWNLWIFVRKPVPVRVFRILGLVVLLYFFCLNYTEPTEVGIARNVVTGTMWLQEGGGWHITAPWVLVAVVDMRPMRVAVTSAGRGFSGKLIQFNQRYWREFVETEGFRYYWWANRFSFNSGYDEEYRGMRDILRGYAFGAKRYPFAEILASYESP